MRPNLRYPSNGRVFITSSEELDIGSGIVLMRAYFQSVRPAIGRMLINVDTSMGVMYKPGPLIDLALAFLRRPGNPNALAPGLGFSNGERMRLQRFISGIRITTTHSQALRTRIVKRLSAEGARDKTFSLANGQSTTVADYFQGVLNRPLQFPDIICVEVCASLYASSE
jgi:eukaryotic translation initiation factor 2C